MAGGDRSFNHGGILLGDLIQLRHADVDFGQPRRLLGRPGGDGRYQRRDIGNRPHNGLQRHPRLANLIHSAADMLGRGCDQRLDLFGGGRGPLRQRPHFGRHHGKTLAGIARARRLDPGVQRQQIGLKGDVVNRPDDLRYLLG